MQMSVFTRGSTREAAIENGGVSRLHAACLRARLNGILASSDHGPGSAAWASTENRIAEAITTPARPDLFPYSGRGSGAVLTRALRPGCGSPRVAGAPGMSRIPAGSAWSLLGDGHPIKTFLLFVLSFEPLSEGLKRGLGECEASP